MLKKRETTLKRNIDKPKELWKTLKALGLPNKVSMATRNAVKEDNVVKYESKSISEVFQTIFASITETLLQKLLPPPNKYGIDLVKKINKDWEITAKFQLKPTTEDIVLKLLKNINISKAAGIDNHDAVILAKPVTKICNLSIKLGIFPGPCKLARLKPLFKSGSRMDPFNYGPISLLPLISKIFEKIVHDPKILIRF